MTIFPVCTIYLYILFILDLVVCTSKFPSSFCPSPTPLPTGNHWFILYICEFASFVLSTSLLYFGASLVAQMVKNLAAVWETQVQSLSCEDPLEKEMATQSSILAWKIPWTEEPGRLQCMGLQRVGHD